MKSQGVPPYSILACFPAGAELLSSFLALIIKNSFLRFVVFLGCRFFLGGGGCFLFFFGGII